MSYQTISSNYLSSNWYQFFNSPVETQKISMEEYKSLGIFSQETNWERVFALGDRINKDLKITEQEILDDLTKFRKRKAK